MIIEFEVILPKIDKKNHSQLKSILSEKINKLENKQEVDEVELSDMDSYVNTSQRRNNFTEEDYEEQGMPQGVECSQQ